LNLLFISFFIFYFLSATFSHKTICPKIRIWEAVGGIEEGFGEELTVNAFSCLSAPWELFFVSPKKLH